MGTGQASELSKCSPAPSYGGQTLLLGKVWRPRAGRTAPQHGCRAASHCRAITAATPPGPPSLLLLCVEHEKTRRRGDVQSSRLRTFTDCCGCTTVYGTTRERGGRWASHPLFVGLVSQVIEPHSCTNNGNSYTFALSRGRSVRPRLHPHLLPYCLVGFCRRGPSCLPLFNAFVPCHWLSNGNQVDLKCNFFPLVGWVGWYLLLVKAPSAPTLTLS